MQCFKLVFQVFHLLLKLCYFRLSPILPIYNLIYASYNLIPFFVNYSFCQFFYSFSSLALRISFLGRLLLLPCCLSSILLSIPFVVRDSFPAILKSLFWRERRRQISSTCIHFNTFLCISQAHSRKDIVQTIFLLLQDLNYL